MPHSQNFFRDLSPSTIAAGSIAVIAGYSSSAIIVFQAAMIGGTTEAQAASWLGVLCIAIGILTAGLSYLFKKPAMFAWSTAGAALLMTALPGVPLAEATGAFIFSSILILVLGFSGLFEKMMNKIPQSIASAMLAGVLLKFVLDIFISMKTQLVLSLLMVVAYFIARRLAPRVTILVALSVGLIISYWQNLFIVKPFDVSMISPVFVMPEFSFATIISIGIPLFVITMASQNVTGITIAKSFGYQMPFSKMIGISGLVNLLIAPLGGFAINLSALTAAICMGPDCHAEPKRRYTAAVFAGFLYIGIGFFSTAVISLFAIFPKELVMTTAGLALMSVVSNGLVTALKKETEIEAAALTFFMTASGINLFGIGSAFWGLVVGALVLISQKFLKNQTK